MSPSTRSALRYPADPIKAPILLAHVAEIPAHSAVDIAAEVIRRLCDIPDGAAIDSSGKLVHHERHETRPTVLRTATDDDRAALHVLCLLAFPRPRPASSATAADLDQAISTGLYSMEEWQAMEDAKYGRSAAERLPISHSPTLPLSPSSAA